MNQVVSKKHKSYPYNFGRVFFPNDCNQQKIPDKILFQLLGNHVGNVMRLVKYWNKNDFPDNYQDSFTRVMQGTKIHDMAKPQTFKIKVETTKKADKQGEGKFKKYIYSFSGHRYYAQHKDKWIESLAQGHHDFSTDCITEDTYKLNKIPEYQEILERDNLAYAKELYILEMCDQIEAELACRVLEDLTHAQERTFI